MISRCLPFSVMQPDSDEDPTESPSHRLSGAFVGDATDAPSHHHSCTLNAGQPHLAYKGSILPTKKLKANTDPDVPNPHICRSSSELLGQQQGVVYPPQAEGAFTRHAAPTGGEFASQLKKEMAFTAPEAIKASNANLCGSTSIKPSRVLDLFYCDKESAKGSIVPTKKRRADTMMSDRDKMAKGGSSPQFLGTYPDVPNPHICPGSSELLEQQRGTVYPPQVLDHYVCEKASTKRSIVPTNKRKANDIIMSNKDKIAKAESTQQILGTGPCAPNHHNCPECPSQVEGSFMGDDDCDAHEFDSHLKKEMASITAAEAIRVSDATLPMKSSRVLHSTKRSMLTKKGKANDTIMSVRDKMASDGSTLQVVEIDHICPESSKALGKQQGVVYMPQVDAPSMGHEAEGSDVDSSLRSYPMKSAKVQFFVKILKKTLSVQKVLNELTVQELIDLSCHIIGVKSDLHAFFAGKPLHPNDLLSKYDICKDSTVHITAGLLGGQRVNFDTTFDVTEETLFDFIELPENLQNPLIIDRDQQMFTYVVKLKRFARRRIKKIIKFFTAKHRAGVCFDGEFERNDIFFEGEEVSLGVNVVALEFFEKGCERDYQKLAVHLGVIHTNDGQFSQYYIQLLSYLGRCPAGGRSRLKPAIAFLIHHPALIYYHDHFMKIHLLANINFCVLDENHGTVIEEAMPDMAEWMSDVMCPEIERILYHNSYEEDGIEYINELYSLDAFGCAHLSNNLSMLIMSCHLK